MWTSQRLFSVPRWVRATALPDSDEEVLKLGRGNTSCKECLPLQLTVGSLLKYLRDRKAPDELLVYFMPTAGGPCRFGQYSQFMKAMIERLGIQDVTLYSPDAENSYADLDASNLTLKLWTGVVIADDMEDIYGVLLTAARDRVEALEIYREECRKIIRALEESPELKTLRPVLEKTATRLKSIPLKRRPEEIPTILLPGEIFVRHDAISRQFLIERLADQGFATKVASVMEWIYYTDLCDRNGWIYKTLSAKEKASLFLRSTWMKKYERTITKILAGSGLIPNRTEDIPHIVEQASPIINPLLLGEAVLPWGRPLRKFRLLTAALRLGLSAACRIGFSEAILNREMNRGMRNSGKHSDRDQERWQKISESAPPFLAIESDGNPFRRSYRQNWKSFSCRRPEFTPSRRQALTASQTGFCPLRTHTTSHANQSTLKLREKGFSVPLKRTAFLTFQAPLRPVPFPDQPYRPGGKGTVPERPPRYSRPSRP
jgi:predicted nucleotide-binding protein (sugar kinase/HSP70/actin superfamily)